MGKRNEFVVASEKGAAETEVGLMMDKKTHKSFPRKKMMMMVMPHHNHHPLVSNSNTAGLSFGGGEDCGVWDHQSLFCNTSNPAAITCVTDLYNAVGSDFGSELLPKSLHHQQQPYSDHTLSLSSSGGGMVNVNVRFPFTRAQRVELEEQAMIYKYMMASLPVPPQLLVPITKNTSNVARLYPNLVRSLDLASTRNVCPDPEPWRCKRTDGKKWRCSRDVAFNQKYCERHANKARIRSRKPVESNPNFININNNRIRSPRSNVFRKNNSNQSSPYSDSNMVSSASAALSHVQPRPMGWFINEETPPAAAGSNSNQEWEQMTQFKLGLKSCSKHENESERQALQAQRPSHDQYDLFCSSPKLGHSEAGLNSSQTQETRHFIDAWSTATSAAAAAASERGGGSRIVGEIGTRGFVCSNQKLPFSSLTLSMSRGYETNEENSEKGLGIFGAERENEGGDLKSQWMMNSGSWMMGSPPGGPLAEALCLGIASSSNGCNSNSGSTSCRSSSGDVRQEYDLIN